MEPSLPILLAALNDVIGVLVTAAFFVIWLINQISDAKKKQAAQAAELPAAAPPPAPPAEPVLAAAQPPADPLRAQIDEFLRRASQAPKQPAPPPPSKPVPRRPAGRDEIVVLIDEAVAPAPGRKPVRAPQPPRERKPAAPSRAAKPRSASVAEHVAQRVGAATQEFHAEVADLGERVKQADEQFDRQIQQKFEHDLGSLGDRSAPRADDRRPSDASATPAAQLAALLATPTGVRQAMILNEILNRPTDRW